MGMHLCIPKDVSTIEVWLSRSPRPVVSTHVFECSVIQPQTNTPNRLGIPRAYKTEYVSITRYLAPSGIMENNPPPNEAFVRVVTSKESRSDLEQVYACMKRYPSTDPQLSDFHDIDAIRRQIVILTDPDRKTDYLVYNSEHKRAREEVCFQTAGYIASFDLPCHGVTRRYGRHIVHEEPQKLISLSPDTHTSHGPSNRGWVSSPAIPPTLPLALKLWTLW